MYDLAITPLITKLHNLCDNAKQVWFATMLLLHLRQWWDQLSNLSPKVWIRSKWSEILPHCQGGPHGGSKASVCGYQHSNHH